MSGIIKDAKSRTLTDEESKQISRIKIAYGILSDPEKRKKYDLDLATKKADKLLQNVQEKQEERQEKQNNYKIQENQKQSQKQVDNVREKNVLSNDEKIRKAVEKEIDRLVEEQEINEIKEKMAIQAEKEEFKRQNKEKRRKQKQAKKQQQLERERQIQEYGRYLQNQGYKVKYPWTWTRVKQTIISIIAIVIGLVILWHIPFVKNSLINLYNENFIIQYVVDTIKSLGGD